MLAQGAKYQKRTSFANDAARAKNCFKTLVVYLKHKSIPFRGVKNSFNFLKKFLVEDVLSHVLINPSPSKHKSVQPYWRSFRTNDVICLPLAIPYQKQIGNCQRFFGGKSIRQLMKVTRWIVCFMRTAQVQFPTRTTG